MDIEQNIFYDEVMKKLHEMECSLIDAHHTKINKKEKIDEIFRAVHTVKSASDLLGFTEVVQLTHKSEDVLDEIRKGNLEFDSNVYYLFMELKRFIEKVVDEIARRYDLSTESKRLLKSFKSELKAYLPKSILIVDDNGELNQLAYTVEEMGGYKTHVAKNRYAAAELIEANNVSLILCDINRPSLGGVELLNEVKVSRNVIPAILLTDNVDPSLVEIGRSTGAKAWLKRPLDMDKVLMMIEKILH